MPKVKKSQEKKEKVSLSLSPDVIRELRSRSPGAPVSALVEIALRSYLERSDMEERLRNMEIIQRAEMIMLSEHLADDAQGAKNLRESAVQKGLGQLKKLEARRKGVERSVDQGAADQGQAES